MGKGGGDTEIKETSQEQELARISNEQWQQYQTRLAPFENEWIKDIPVTAAEKSRATGQVAAETSLTFENAAKQAQDKSTMMGVDPSSGQARGLSAGVTLNRAKATGRALSTTDQAMDDQYYQGLQGAVDMGRGQSAQAMKDTSSIAKDASQTAISDAYTKQISNDSIKSTAMTAAGMGLAGWQNAGKGDMNSVWYKAKQGDMMDLSGNPIYGGK